MTRATGRLVALVLVATLAVAAAPATCRAADEASRGERFVRFADQWLVNGNAIGNAIGAVVGQMLAGCLFPGPVGMTVGTLLGTYLGGYLGTFVDDRVGVAVNYTAFGRPPITNGGMWLQGVGPWEQFMYQVDQFAINGGNYAALACHLMLNIAARSIPGCGALANPITLIVADYLAGTIGDNVDGSIDLGLVGRRLDERAAANGSGGLKDAYLGVLEQCKSGTRQGARRAFEGYRDLGDSTRDLRRPEGTP